jgi:hypothetical protein
MSFLKIICLILILFFSHFCDYGQNIIYSDLISDNSQSFIFKIAGRIDKTIHVWRIPDPINGKVQGKPTISLFVFSDRMKLINENDIAIENDKFTFIDLAFQINGDNYYVVISYFNGNSLTKHQLLKVNKQGNFSDQTFRFTDWENKQLGKADYANFHSAKYAVASNTKFLIEANSENQAEKLPSYGTDTSKNKIIIRKKYPGNQQPESEILYSSPEFNFDHPRIALADDNSAWICSSQAISKNNKVSSSEYSFFFVKLDSNLKELPNSMKFLKTSNPSISKNNIYSLQDIFLLDNNIFLISFGNVFHNYQVEIHEINSLNIIQLNESVNILSDTSIDVNSPYSKLDLGNFYCSSSGKEIDLLCSQQFPHNFNGIRHIVINKNSVKGNDIHVDPHYNYSLQDSKRIDKNTFLIPYTNNDKVGFVKYSNGDL